jgi:F-type H+-transporting ATPase subunit b
MTTKEKYELIDKSQVSEKLLTILQNMEKSSKNFTDEAVNSRVDSALDKIIEGFKAKKPEALRTITEAKKEVKKEKEKAIKKNEGKDFSDKKDTDDKTGLPKKDTLEERKEIIKKESETEKEARERAKKELEKEKEKAKDEIESQIEKLNRLILEDPALRGFNTGTAATGGGKSTPIIDAERKALPRGSRVSKKGWKNQYGASDGGRKYWENRENRSDRKSPEYETGKPYLAKGGNVYSSDDMYEITMVQDGIELDSKLIRARNKGEARMIFEDMY